MFGFFFCFSFSFIKATSIIPEGGCSVGWEERRTGGMQCGKLINLPIRTIQNRKAGVFYVLLDSFIGFVS